MPSADRTPSDIYPSLVYDDAPAAIEWLCRVFGFTKRLVVPGEKGTIRHSELSLGSGVIMVCSARPEEGRVSPRHLQGGSAHGLSVWVSDVDAHHRRSVAAGARIVRPLRDEPHGFRGYMAEDVEGHHWYFGDYRPGEHWVEQPKSR